MIWRKIILFNDAINDLGLDSSLIPEILNLYSTVNVELALFPDSEHVLNELRSLGVKLGLVTNGSVGTQRNKIRLLEVEVF